YYSYLITDEEFEQLKKSIGKFISINTFLITTFQREKAFLALKQANNSHKILFEIYANPSINDIQPYADIKLFNSSINQSQILFMLGSIFHIENFSQQDDIWICQMKLSSRNHPDLKNIFEQIQKEDGDIEKDLISFGNFLARIGQYDNAEKYYKHILNELPSNHLDIHIVYRNLGNVAYIKNNYDQSLEYHLKSLEIKKRLFKNDDSNIADSYNCLGIVYFNKNNYKQAINSYEKALKILNSTSDNDHSKIAACLNNISLVYRTEQNYSKALEYYKKVLDIEKKYLSEDHIDLGQTYHNIGALYWCCGFYDNAMEYYNLSLENKYRYLPSNHSSIAMTLENIGLIHENKNNVQEALKYYREAAAIYRQTLSSTHSDILQIENNISRAYLRQSFNNGKTKSLSWRKKQIEQIYKMCDEQKHIFASAAYTDFHRPKSETILFDCGAIRNECIHTLNHIDEWVRDKKMSDAFIFAALDKYIHPEPLGISLIIGSWNYPFLVTLTPLIGAIAAGNCVILKPSELAPNSAVIMATMIERYLDTSCIRIVLGGVEQTQILLKSDIDKIFYTGSTIVAKIIMRAAAEKMIPVTLECGGKNPVYIADDANIEICARRIAWGKTINCGQT
ncbi:unnamed protein product, partial [Rotaria sp. Silwood1]